MMEQAFIDFKSRNAQLERRKGVRIKGGVGPQERGSRKIEKEEQEIARTCIFLRFTLSSLGN